VGRRRSAAARGAVRRAAPEAVTTGGGSRVDLAVLCGPHGYDVATVGELMRHGVAHLVVEMHEGTGSVGPLVLPGRSSCLRCRGLDRTDRDPDYPLLAAALADEQATHRSGSLVLAMLTAALAAGQVLAVIDDVRSRPPQVLEGSLEVSVTRWRIRRRTRPAHPECGCRGLPG
jgi:hypothetical protein